MSCWKGVVLCARACASALNSSPFCARSFQNMATSTIFENPLATARSSTVTLYT